MSNTTSNQQSGSNFVELQLSNESTTAKITYSLEFSKPEVSEAVKTVNKVVYPRRGTPPPVPKGWHTEGDLFVHIRDYPECVYHTNRHRCALLGLVVNHNICEKCTLRPSNELPKSSE